MPTQTKSEFWEMSPQILHKMWIHRHTQVGKLVTVERTWIFVLFGNFISEKFHIYTEVGKNSIVNPYYPDSAIFKILSYLLHQSPFFFPKYLKVSPRYCHFTVTCISKHLWKNTTEHFILPQSPLLCLTKLKAPWYH